MRIIYVTALRAMEDSVMLDLPKAVLESLSLAPDMLISLSVAEGRLVVEPRRRPSYRLSDLVHQCDPSGRLTDEDLAWLEAPAACPEEV